MRIVGIIRDIVENVEGITTVATRLREQRSKERELGSSKS